MSLELWTCSITLSATPHPFPVTPGASLLERPTQGKRGMAVLPGALGPLIQPWAPSGYWDGLVTAQQTTLCSLLCTYRAASTQTDDCPF